MDQVKQVLAVLKKYHFWVLCVLLLLVGLGSWQVAATTLANRYRERESKLKSARTEVENIKKAQAPPNQAVIDSIKNDHGKLKEEVFEAWKVLYQAQKENNPWPQVLSPEFIEAAEALKPNEEFKDPKYLEEYQNFIKNHLPRLGLIVDVLEPKWMREYRLGQKTTKRTPLAKRKVEKKKPAEEKEGAEEKAKQATEPLEEEELVGKVIWDENNQAMIEQQFYWETRPTTLQVLIAQEDLWVYEALLRIIRDTNEGATSYYNAPVKRIFSLEIGQAAAANFAMASRGSFGPGGMYGAPFGPMGGMPGMRLGSGPGYGMPGMSMMPSAAATPTTDSEGATPGAPGSVTGAAAPTSIQEMIAQQLLNGRYLDKNGMPLLYGTEPPFPQFKMMPVRMLLLVDQRRIPALLAQCANSSMPVEVKRVTLRPEEAQSSLNLGGFNTGMAEMGAPGMSTPMPSGSMMPGSMPGAVPGRMPGRIGGSTMPRGRPSMGMPGMRMGSSEEEGIPSAGYPMGPGVQGQLEEPTWEMTVDIQGIIYIFNPPDRSRFEKTEATGAEGATPGPSGAAGTGSGTPGSPVAQPPADATAPAASQPPAPAGSQPAAPGAPQPAAPAATQPSAPDGSQPPGPGASQSPAPAAPQPPATAAKQEAPATAAPDSAKTP